MHDLDMFTKTGRGMHGTSFARMIQRHIWTPKRPIVDQLAVTCYACRRSAAGGRHGFCCECLDFSAAEDLGGES